MIWFERSGHAGHYRTLVNQLVSFNLEQVDTRLNTILRFFVQVGHEITDASSGNHGNHHFSSMLQHKKS